MSRWTFYKFWREKSALGPTAIFKRGLARRLSDEWARRYGSAVLWYRTNAFKWSLSVAAMLMIFVAGTSAYAYTDPGVSDGNILYPIKHGIEKVAEKMQKTPEQKATFYLKQLERRKEEAALLAADHKDTEAVSKHIDQIENKIQKTEPQLAESADEDSSVWQEVENHLQEREIQKTTALINASAASDSWFDTQQFNVVGLDD